MQVHSAAQNILLHQHFHTLDRPKPPGPLRDGSAGWGYRRFIVGPCDAREDLVSIMVLTLETHFRGKRRPL